MYEVRPPLPWYLPTYLYTFLRVGLKLASPSIHPFLSRPPNRSYSTPNRLPASHPSSPSFSDRGLGVSSTLHPYSTWIQLTSAATSRHFAHHRPSSVARCPSPRLAALVGLRLGRSHPRSSRLSRRFSPFFDTSEIGQPWTRNGRMMCRPRPCRRASNRRGARLRL